MRLILVVLCLSACASNPVKTASLDSDQEYCASHVDVNDDNAQVGCLIDLEEAHAEEYRISVRQMGVK